MPVAKLIYVNFCFRDIWLKFLKKFNATSKSHLAIEISFFMKLLKNFLMAKQNILFTNPAVLFSEAA